MFWRTALLMGWMAASGTALASAPPSLTLAMPPSAMLEAQMLEDTVGDVQQMLSTLGIEGTVTSRRKSAHSTWLKMRRKGLTLEQVTDRLALRVHVNTVAECYAVTAALHAAHAVRYDEFDDYIATPKPNGYASIHTVLELAHGPVEVQIRTHGMHEQAESGPAAHWRYKQAQVA